MLGASRRVCECAECCLRHVRNIVVLQVCLVPGFAVGDTLSGPLSGSDTGVIVSVDSSDSTYGNSVMCWCLCLFHLLVCAAYTGTR